LGSVMNKIPAPEAKLLYSLPPEPRKRLRRMLFLGFVGSFLFFLFLGGALSGLMGRGLLQWKIGWILLLFPFLVGQDPDTWYILFGLWLHSDAPICNLACLWHLCPYFLVTGWISPLDSSRFDLWITLPTFCNSAKEGVDRKIS